MTTTMSEQPYNGGEVLEYNQAITVTPQFNKKGELVFPDVVLNGNGLEKIIVKDENSIANVAFLLPNNVSIRLPKDIEEYIRDQGDLSPQIIRPNTSYESLSVFSKTGLICYYSKDEGVLLTHPIATDTIELINFLQDQIDK